MVESCCYLLLAIHYVLTTVSKTLLLAVLDTDCENIWSSFSPTTALMSRPKHTSPRISPRPH